MEADLGSNVPSPGAGVSSAPLTDAFKALIGAPVRARPKSLPTGAANALPDAAHASILPEVRFAEPLRHMGEATQILENRALGRHACTAAQGWFPFLFLRQGHQAEASLGA